MSNLEFCHGIEHLSMTQYYSLRSQNHSLYCLQSNVYSNYKPYIVSTSI